MICEWMYISVGEYGSLVNVDIKKVVYVQYINKKIILEYIIKSVLSVFMVYNRYVSNIKNLNVKISNIKNPNVKISKIYIFFSCDKE